MTNSDKPRVPPEYWLIKIDERGFWREDIQMETKALYGVYAFNRNLHVHICSLTPSIELHFLDNDWEHVDDLSDELKESLDEVIMSLPNYEPVTYMDVSTIDRLLAAHPERGRKVEVEVDPDDDKFDPFEALREDWATGSLRF